MVGKLQTFSEAVTAELVRFPRTAWFLVCAWALIQWSLALVTWIQRPAPSGWVTYPLLLTLPCLFAISYFCISRLVEMPMTWRKAVRFFATAAAIVVPAVLLLIGALLLTRVTGLLLGFIVAAPALIAVFVVFCLPGWPVWQLTSLGWVGPLKAWRATKGIRWSLFSAAFIPTIVARQIPSLKTTEDLVTAVALAGANAAFAIGSTVFGLCVAVAAYRTMAASSRI